MGIDLVGLQAILKSFKYVDLKRKNNCLTLGRQQFHLDYITINQLLTQFTYFEQTNNTQLYCFPIFCEKFFEDFSFDVLSIDNSKYENASIEHNLNYAFHFDRKFDFILDGGTSEHIFNQVQLSENIINLLNVGGIYCSITCNNNFSGHGMYQFSPEFFLSVFNEKYGMKVLELYLGETNSECKDWINVNSYEGYRNMTKLNSEKEIYIIAIIQKISDKRESLIINPPNQFSYEEIVWKK